MILVWWTLGGDPLELKGNAGAILVALSMKKLYKSCKRIFKKNERIDEYSSKCEKVVMSLKKSLEVLTNEEEISYWSDWCKVVPVNKQQFKRNASHTYF